MMEIVIDKGNTKSQEVLDAEKERDMALDAGAEWDGKVWHSDAVFSSQLTAFLAAYREGILPAGATVEIRSKDNAVNQLSRAQLLQLAGAVMSHVQGVYKRSWARKDAVH